MRALRAGAGRSGDRDPFSGSPGRDVDKVRNNVCDPFAHASLRCGCNSPRPTDPVVPGL